MERFLTVLRQEGVQIPDNINDIIYDVHTQYTLIEKAAWRWFDDALPELIANGARVTFRVFETLQLRPNAVLAVLQAGANPNVDPSITGATPFFVFGRCYDSFVHLLDYGCTIPSDWKLKMLGPDEYRYVQLVQEREARCRAALVALGAYCRRSPYHALRAWYRELAKCMWRMRGPAGCGPRGVVWAEIK